MRPDHRHELKTNELAEWLSNLPRWAKENRTFIIFISAVIIVAAFFYIWRIRGKDVASRKQLELTSLVGQIISSKAQILQAAEQGRDFSFVFLQPAENLRIFAESTTDDQMAAFALIKQAEALRTELHYRLGAVPEQEAATQINRAKAGYTEALERLVAPAASLSRSKTTGGCPANPLLMAAAKFGVGLCEEELGNFEIAEQIYRDITTNSDFEGTVPAAQAKLRLETMADYKQKIVFKPAPKLKPAAPEQPPTLPKPGHSALEAPDTNASPLTLNSTIEAGTPVNDINQPSK